MIHVLTIASTFCFYLLLLTTLLVVFSSSLFAKPFAWQSDELFQHLEHEFLAARQLSQAEVAQRFTAMEQDGLQLMDQLSANPNISLPNKQLTRLETLQFEMGALAAAHSLFIKRLQSFSNKLHQHILQASAHWQADEQQIPNKGILPF